MPVNLTIQNHNAVVPKVWYGPVPGVGVDPALVGHHARVRPAHGSLLLQIWLRKKMVSYKGLSADIGSSQISVQELSII